jgi:very-short-patch-repair endonuclease
MRSDLVDRDRRIVLEADSFEWHGDRAALRRDAKRYNRLVIDGWIVLRFAWEDVMFDQDYVRDVLVAVVAFVDRRRKAWGCTCGAA